MKKVKQNSGWTITKAQIPRVAPPHAHHDAGAFLLWRLASRGKKLALTVSQLRMLLHVVLPWRTYSVEDILKLVAWLQQRNHRAYLAHRKRRETEG